MTFGKNTWILSSVFYTEALMRFRWLLAGQVRLWTCKQIHFLCHLSFFPFLIYPFWYVVLNPRFSPWVQTVPKRNELPCRQQFCPFHRCSRFWYRKARRAGQGPAGWVNATPHLRVYMAQLLNRCTVSLLGGRSVFLSGFWVWKQIPWHSCHVWGEFSMQVSERGAVKTLTCFVSVPCFLYDSLAPVGRIIHSFEWCFCADLLCFLPREVSDGPAVFWSVSMSPESWRDGQSGLGY